MSVTFRGYTEAGRSEPHATFAAWLNQKSDELEKEIIVQWVGDHTATPKSDEDEGKVVIFDLATPHEGLRWGVADYMYLVGPNGEQMDSNGRSPYLSLNSSRNYIPTPEHLNGNMGFETVPTGATSDNRQWGVVGKAAVYTSIQLSNIAKDRPNIEYANEWYSEREMLWEASIGHMLKLSADDEYREVLERDRREKIIKEFTEASGGRGAGRVDKFQRRLTELQTHESTLQAQLIEISRLINDAGNDVNYAKQMAEEEKTKFAGVLDGIWDHAMVNNVTWTVYDGQGTLTVRTEDIYMYSPDKDERVLLGKFDIKINPNNRSVLFAALGSVRNGRMHPHVPETGSACWGGQTTLVTQLLMDWEIMPFIDLCINFLQGYNPNDSWGSWASYWFTEEDTEKLQEDGTYMKATEVTADGTSDEVEALLNINE